MSQVKIPGGKGGDGFYVVGIGASAGGLDAIQELFDNLPANTGHAFVLIQHLSPDHKSLLKEILSKHTEMPLHEAKNGMLVEPNTVYIIPNKKLMTIRDGHLVLRDKEAGRVPNNAIDIFFESLAADMDKNSVGIVLSGTGSDGSKGIEAIKQHGGVTIVQDPTTAAFDGMPNSAIQSGFSDLVLPPEMIGDELQQYLLETPYLQVSQPLSSDDEAAFRNILEHIKKETAQDFTQYKLTTLSRRLAKRIHQKGFTDMQGYYALLQNDRQETIDLARDFLINVTRFFRDPEAFDVLVQEVFPAIFLERRPGDEVKMWVAACSTGQEAYSLAILVHEYLEKAKVGDVNIKIFATDVDQDALNVAIKGCYTADELKDLSQARRDKYFVRDGNYLQAVAAIRKMVVFARHDVINDPPFSKVDLLSCRNMLIYMSHPLQKAVLKKLHFALNEHGFLFLGPSENPAIIADYLKEVSRKWKIYRCSYKTKTYDDERYLTGIADRAAGYGVARGRNPLSNIADIFRETLLDEYNFTGILVDRDLQVKQAVGNFKSILQFPDGNFHLGIQKLLPPDLAIAVNMAARKAITTGERVVTKGIKVTEGDRQRRMNLVIKPFLDQREYTQPFLFLVFEEVEPEQVKKKKLVTDDHIGSTERILELEDELRDVRQNLQSVIEEVETANEELQTSNEEIISSNEELQSTNEELQSLNEELHTVNAELQMKIRELIELNDDLNNYFNNSDIGQILIDGNLVIRKFTPTATRHVNLIDSDVGRSIADISTNFKRVELTEEVRKVMETGRPVEKELLTSNHRNSLLRISPYVRQDKTLEGVVINFIDISEVKRLGSILEAIFNNSPNAILSMRPVLDKRREVVDFEFTASNKNAERFLGARSSLTGKMLLEEQLYINYYFPQFVNVMRTNTKFYSEYFDKSQDHWFEMIATKMADGILLTITDVNEKKLATDLLKDSYEKLKETTEALNITVGKLEKSNFNLAQFASVASHDLKEPLRKIQILGDMLRERAFDKLDSGEQTHLDKMIKASGRMQTLIDNVLAFSKLSNKDVEMETADLNLVVQQIVDDMEMLIKEKNATITLGKLPVVQAKAGQMRQLLQNLISNALKFTTEKPPVIKIEQVRPTAEDMADGRNADNYLFLRVTDNGIGFDERYTEKIFGLFQRLHGSEYQGTGLGLAICKKIVDEHKGYINVKSKPGKGAQFTVALPK